MWLRDWLIMYWRSWMDPLLDGPIEHIATGFQERCPASDTLAVQFGECRVRVISNSLPLLTGLRRYYQNWIIDSGTERDLEVIALEGPVIDPGLLQVKTPDPGKTRIKEEFREIPGGRVVRKRLTGMLFVFGSGVNLALGPCEDNANQVINFINNRYLQWMLDRGCLLFHAAGVSRNQTGLALAGFAGRGKSTVTLRLIREGWCFVSNDRLLIRKEEKGNALYGVAKHPRVNPGTLLADPVLRTVLSEGDRRRYADLPSDRLWGVEHKHDVYLDEIFGKEKMTPSLKAPFSTLILLNWRRDGGPARFHRVTLRERSDLMDTFIKSPGLFYQPNPDRPQPDFSETRYLELLHRTPVFEVTGGVDFDAAARFALTVEKSIEEAGTESRVSSQK